MRGSIAESRQVVALFGHQPTQALALAAEDQDDARRQVERLQRRRARRVQPDDPVAALLQLGQRAAEIDHLDQRHEVERTGCRLGAGAAQLGAAAVREDDALDAQCCGRAQDGAEIARDR